MKLMILDSASAHKQWPGLQRPQSQTQANDCFSLRREEGRVQCLLRFVTFDLCEMSRALISRGDVRLVRPVLGSRYATLRYTSAMGPQTTPFTKNRTDALAMSRRHRGESGLRVETLRLS